MKRKILLLCAVLILALSGCQAGRERSGESGEEGRTSGNRTQGQTQDDADEAGQEEGKETYERDSSPGQKISLTLEEMRQMIDEDQSFLIVFTKEDCPYCIEFAAVCERYIQNHNLTVYEVNLTAENRSENDNRMIIQTYFPEFNTVPGVFSVRNGEEESYLNLYQLGISEEILDNWVLEYRLDEKRE